MADWWSTTDNDRETYDVVTLRCSHQTTLATRDNERCVVSVDGCQPCEPYDPDLSDDVQNKKRAMTNLVIVELSPAAHDDHRADKSCLLVQSKQLEDKTESLEQLCLDEEPAS